MNEVTRILSAVEQGDPRAANKLLPLVYDELRRLAAQKLAQEFIEGEEVEAWNESRSKTSRLGSATTWKPACDSRF